MLIKNVIVLVAVYLGTTAAGRIIQPSANAVVVPDSHIVVLKEMSASKLKSHMNWIRSLEDDCNHSENRTSIKHYFGSSNFKGYAGKFSKNVLKQLVKSKAVAYIEQDSYVYAKGIQKDSPWGISRVISKASPKGLTLDDTNSYTFDNNGGKGVNVYVIDTGVKTDHDDFEGRAKFGANFVDNISDDGNGHGSHVSGTIAGKRFGVAKKANIIAVKALDADGAGLNSDVIASVDFVIKDHKARKSAVSVANLSLGGGSSAAVDTAVNNAVKAGVVVVVAAGNDDSDACLGSPSGASEPIVVGAANIKDTRSSFSNTGKCVDVFAPGEDIDSVGIGSNSDIATFSGTSQATPHVAGVAAYFISFASKNQTVTASLVKDQILKFSTKDLIKGIPTDTTNSFLFRFFE